MNWEDAPESVRQRVKNEIGEYTQRDLALAQVIANMAIDVCRGDKNMALEYVTEVCQKEPEVQRLMGGYGMLVAESNEAFKKGKVS